MCLWIYEEEKNIIMPIIFKNNFSNIEEMDVSDRIKHVLSFYKNYRAEIADPNSELFKMKQEFEKKRTEWMSLCWLISNISEWLGYDRKTEGRME